MLFNSFAFFGFFALVLAIYWSVGDNEARKRFLVGCSYLFYAGWDYRFCALLAGVTCVAHVGAKAIASSDRREMILSACIALLLGVLGIFKYANFFVESFAAVFHADSVTLQIILPVGISFYVFHAISYLVDVYRREIEPEYSVVDVALYIAFFPQLVAGPILRATQFLPQMKSLRTLSWPEISEGVHLFLIGWCYKVILADSLSEIVDPVYANPEQWTGGSHWTATLAYAGQIYFDFAGYSSMAIGVALLLGYRMPRNFAYPYSALSITEFWRRWHISLSTWLRDYLFIPLGGNRGGRGFYYRNLMVTMILGGLWHGASWNFVIWGAIHGCALIVHKLWTRSPSSSLAANTAGLILTQLTVVIAWVFFRAQTFEQSGTIIAGMFGIDPPGAVNSYNPMLTLIVLLPVVADAFIGRWVDIRGFLSVGRWSAVAIGSLVAVLLWLHPLSSAPFIYFQF